MFINNLNKDQQAVLLYLAHEVVSVDDEVHEQEEAMLQILKSQSANDVYPEEVSFEKLPEIFNSNRSKASLLMELIALAFSDGTYQVEEKSFIQEISKALDIENQKLLQLEGWVRKQLLLSIEAEELLK